jgi:hypothetical protein
MSIPPEFIGVLPTNPTLADFSAALRPLANAASRLNPVPGVIFNEAAVVGAIAGGSQQARNANNIYYAAFFPTISHLDQFTSYSFDPDAAIVIDRIAPLPSTVTYLDINFYLRGQWPNPGGLSPNTVTFIPSPLGATNTEWNGTINQTITTYEYTGTIAGATGPSIDRVVYGCNRAVIAQLQTTNTIVRTCPLEFTQSLTAPTGAFLPQSILFRAVIPSGSAPLTLNQYFRIRYYKPGVAGSVMPCPCVTGPAAYYTLVDSPTQYYITPLRADYPINAPARAVYQAFVNQFAANPNLTQLPVENYFENEATVFPGPIDSGYRAMANNFNIFFDNRSVSYSDVYFTTIQAGDTLYALQFNHKLEPGRCQYASVSFYNGDDSSLLSSTLTIPADVTPTNDYFMVVFTNTTPGPLSVGIAFRIYNYLPPAYGDSAPDAAFILKFDPSTL